MEAAVAGVAPLEPRPQEEDPEDDGREQRRRPRTGSARACSSPIVRSKPGTSRSAPISQPRYQSGCAPFVESPTWYGPQSQIGLICTRPPSRKSTPNDREHQAERARRLPGERRARRRRVASSARRAGTACGGASATSSRCTREQRPDRDREHEDVRDVHPRPERRAARERPAPDAARRGWRRRTGSRARPSSRSRAPCPRAGRRPSSSRCSPRAARASSIVSPMQYVRSRGLRNAPVKKTRSRCRTIAARNTFAAQWCVWRISSPALTSSEMSTTDAYAARHLRAAAAARTSRGRRSWSRRSDRRRASGRSPVATSRTNE